MAIDVKRAAIFHGPDAPTEADLATCVHCGCCLNSCPTFRITGLEPESPRGRIYTIIQLRQGAIQFNEEVARHLDTCLGCRTCEPNCPSDVPYGRIIEHARGELDRARGPSVGYFLKRAALREVVAHPARLRAMGIAIRAAQAAGIGGLLPNSRMLPRLRAPFRPPAGGVVQPLGERRFRVAFLVGCVMPVMYGDVHRASVRLLQLAGCEVWFPRQQTCCGALAAHNGDLEGARQLRDSNVRAFGREGFDYLIVNSAGCGAHLKDFYGEMAKRVRDLSQFLVEVGLPKPSRELKLRVSYQDPCHLAHAQGIRREPRRLISSIPGIELVDTPRSDACCGAAGIYSLLEPEMSQKVLAEKMDDVLSVGVDALITANPGCHMQLEAGLRDRGVTWPVLDLAELLSLAYADGA
jgi:glycolate oxidase iron-sulfur subunit